MTAAAIAQPGTTEMSPLARSIYEQKYAWKDENGKPIEEWPDTAHRVTKNVLGAVGYKEGDSEFDAVQNLITERKFMPGGRYLYASGRELHQTQNCLLLRAEDSREGWAELLSKSAMALQTGAGIGIDYSDIRPSGSIIRKTGGIASGPLALMQMVNEIGRGVMQGGSRRSAIWAGLNWSHADAEEFLAMKHWSPQVKQIKATDFSFPAVMEFTNMSILLDDEFFEAYQNENHPKHKQAERIYARAVSGMVARAEPGLSVDVGENAGETLRNACTEITSRDDSDICNLGSINLARITSKSEMTEAVELGTLFLLAGTVYSHVPYEKVGEVREKNRRLGLGIMGVHEWLLRRGHRYEANDDLGEWLDEYAKSGDYADYYADNLGMSRPIKTRAIAPTGTIGIVAQTTTGIEPVFCVALKRRYLHGRDWKYQYVVDPTAQNLIADGVAPDEIEDAYALSYDVERRVKFQSWAQQWVDHGISSTINIPYPITDADEAKGFGDMLLPHLPNLRGITVYPDGAMGGQPLTPVPYETAINSVGVVFDESEDAACKGGVCGV
jgi:ribonucleoside-diphosphate reductase alpha chain